MQTRLTPPPSPNLPPPLTLRLFGVTIRRPALKLRFLRSEGSFTAEKRQLIEAIRSANPSATAKFLGGFDERALQQYLDHLNEGRARQTEPESPEASAERQVA